MEEACVAVAVAVLFECGVGYETAQRAEKGLKQREEREVGGSRLESEQSGLGKCD